MTNYYLCEETHTHTHTHTSGKEDMGITWNAHLLAWGPWTLGGTIIALG